jgi:hypothetical protein
LASTTRLCRERQISHALGATSASTTTNPCGTVTRASRIGVTIGPTTVYIVASASKPRRASADVSAGGVGVVARALCQS